MKDLLYFTLVPTTYLTSVVLFILGLKRLRSVRSARGGNALTATAMVLILFFDQFISSFTFPLTKINFIEARINRWPYFQR